MIAILIYAFKSRRFWWFNALSRTKARFRRTILGSFWLGLSTVLSTACLASVYQVIFKVEDPLHFTLYIGFGLCFWNILSMAISSSPTFFESNRDSLNNTNMPIIFYLLQEWAFVVQSLLQTFLLTFIAGVIVKPDIIFSTAFVIVPVFLFIITLFWLPALICIIGARFQDLYQLIPVGMTLLFLLSPLLYYEDRLGSIAWLAKFNPFYQSIAVIRDAILGIFPGWFEVLYLLSFNLAGLLSLSLVYKKLKLQLKFMV